MAPRKYDRYMVAFGAGRHVKFRRLSIPERYAFFLGALSIAGQAPERGCLRIGNLPAEAEDVAAEADVPVKAAASALEKLRAIGVIYSAGGFEWVHDFDDWNPPPKVDVTNSERQQRYRDRKNNERNALRNGVTSRVGNAPEVKREVEEEITTAATPQRSRAGTRPDSQVETVDCPRCKAPAGEQCNGVRGKRKSAHLERHHAVGELTHITGKPAQRVSRPNGRAVKPYTPDPEMTRLRDEHFPGVEVTAVEGAAATLRFRGLPVTVDALRAVIFGAPGGDTAA